LTHFAPEIYTRRRVGNIDVLVIGAGMAGVAAARVLARDGLAVAVVEGRERTGGRVSSVRDFCAEPVEGGAEFVHTADAAIWPEIRAAGLAVRPCPLARNSMFNLGGRTRWLPWLLLHPGVWPAFPILRQIRRVGPEDMSAAEFIERHRYRGRARVLAEMTLTAHLPGSVDEVGVRGLLEDRVLQLETGSYHRVVDGYDRLTDHVGAGLDIRLGFGVETVWWAPDGVRVATADGRELSARAAISTLPLGVLKSGAVRFVPALPEGKRSALAQLEMGPVLKLLLHFREPFWPRWLTNLGCGTGPVTLYWPVFYGATSRPAVLTAYCTGPRAARLSRRGEGEGVDVVLADLRRLFPRADPRGALLAWRRIDWARDPFACGGYTFVRPGGTGARVRLAAPDTGALFWAGAATATPTIADTVQAAYLSGLRAAGDVRAFLEGAAGAVPPLIGRTV
jgi:monoamine oxidase